jgi:hypothetical protein
MRLNTAPVIPVAESGPPYRHRWLPLGSAGLRYRLGVVVRAVAAIFGGYMVSALWATALAVYLPAARAEASLTGIMVAFVVYPCAAMWVFAAKSAARAWLGLCLLAALPGAAMLFFYFGGSPV